MTPAQIKIPDLPESFTASGTIVACERAYRTEQQQWVISGTFNKLGMQFDEATLVEIEGQPTRRLPLLALSLWTRMIYRLPPPTGPIEAVTLIRVMRWNDAPDGKCTIVSQTTIGDLTQDNLGNAEWVTPLPNIGFELSPSRSLRTGDNKVLAQFELWTSSVGQVALDQLLAVQPLEVTYSLVRVPFDDASAALR